MDAVYSKSLKNVHFFGPWMIVKNNGLNFNFCVICFIYTKKGTFKREGVNYTFENARFVCFRCGNDSDLENDKALPTTTFFQQ